MFDDLLKLVGLEAILETGNGLENLILFMVALTATFVVAKGVQVQFVGRFKRWADLSESDLDDALVAGLQQPVNVVLITIGLRLTVHMLVLPDGLRDAIDKLSTVALIGFVAWTLNRVIDAVMTAIVNPWVEGTDTKLDDQIVPILEKTFKFGIYSLALLMGISNLGYDIFSLLTGLGIGGLAVAMAAQHTLSNIIGSITIFADQPFQIDDLITVEGHTGVVTEVGLRTLKMQAFDGNIVYIPNATVVAEPVVNRSPGDVWRHSSTIGMPYDTTGDELKAAMAAVAAIFEAHTRVRNDYTVRFMNFGDSALEVQFAFWVDQPSIAVYLDTVSEVNLAIKDAFDANGWSMAFPSMSVYLEKS